MYLEMIPNGYQENSCLTHKAGVFIETGLHKLFERFAVGSLQSGRGVLGDEEQNPHGMQV